MISDRLIAVNPIQKKLLDFADTIDLGSRTYYKLSKELGIDHPYKVKFALQQLEKKGLLIKNKQTGSITKPTARFTGLISIPYYGEVNCGQPLAFAEDMNQGYLRVSPSTLMTKSFVGLFALKAVGQSMNKANINGRAVYHGDYLINQKIEPHQVRNGDYIISVIGGSSNLKRFFKDSLHQRLLLVSESSDEIPPIIISSHDADEASEYIPVARTIEVIPAPTLL